MATVYPFDPTGTSSANRISNEQKVITAVNFRKYHYVIPDFAPFFKNNFQIKIQYEDGTVRDLVEGRDYYFSNQFIDASRACAKPVYGSISFLDTSLYGIMTISYNTVGGMWNLTPQEILRILAEEMRNPRITTWEQITYLPERFPVVDHEWDLVDMVGAKEVVASIDGVTQAIYASNAGGLGAHINNLDNPHSVTKAQVGLGAVQNYGISTQLQATTGLINTAYMTPLRTREAINTFGAVLVSAHSSRIDNPHGVTKAQVGLSSVDNNPTANNQEALAGVATNRFMTPANVRAVLDAGLTASVAHAANKQNPHDVTKAQVGLFNVENYLIATEQEARAGILNDRYMTPLRAMQLVREFVSVQLDGHATLTNNPHQVTKDQVGLALVQNFGIATTADMVQGSANDKYVTPALVAYRLNLLYANSIEPHVLDTDNPHQVTAQQVGAYSVSQVNELLEDYLQASDTAMNSVKLGGRTTEELRDWLMTNMPNFNAGQLGGATREELTEQIESAVVGSLGSRVLTTDSVMLESTATGTHTWLKLGEVFRMIGGENGTTDVSFDAGFIVAVGAVSNSNPAETKTDFLMVRTNLFAANPVVETARVFATPTTNLAQIGSVWTAAESKLEIFAKVPKAFVRASVSDISGHTIATDDGIVELASEPLGISYTQSTSQEDIDARLVKVEQLLASITVV